MSSPLSNSTPRAQSHDRLIDLISPWVAPLGYQVIHIEIQAFRHKVLRIFIDYLEPTPEKSIGIEDCVKVSRALDEPLENSPELAAELQGAYELEVSSPGADRPLRTAQDFERFKGNRVKIHIFRPLTKEEIGNDSYQEKNSRQKNFLGVLNGFHDGRVELSVTDQVKVTIPISLISKANIEPEFDFGESNDERE